ncbi:fasciclin domain-containing protein [Chitinophaga flava]|nr:fasciclin domain-containing protein [Chitinophaga flava]
MKRYFHLLLLFLMAVACNKTDLAVSEERPSDIRAIGDFIRNNYDLSLLSAALQQTGLIDSLNTNGTLTVWAPDNAAFKALGVLKPGDFSKMNQDSLRASLRNLIQTERLFIPDIPTQMDNKYIAMGGGPLYISISAFGNNADNYRATVNGCYVYEAPKRNLSLRNGVLHLLKGVPKYFPQTAQDFLAADTSLSIFVTLMKKSGQWEALKNEGPYTVYAPQNNVFQQYGLTADSINRLDVKKYKPVAFSVYTLGLQPHHIFAGDLDILGAYNSRILLDGYGISPGGSINIWAPNGYSGYHSPGFIGYAGGVKGQDNLTSNAVVFRLNNIMLYPDSLLIK